MKQKNYSPPVYLGQNIYIRPRYIVSVPEFYYENKKTSLKFDENKKNLANNRHKGIISAKAATNLKNAINWLVLSASNKRVFCKRSSKNFFFKVSFITLTLPDTAEPIGNRDFQSKLLNPFLVYCRKYFGLKNYVWKLELQKNGKIHCHITADSFIHWRSLRNAWNRLLINHGYMAEFKAVHGHTNPNSTDIHTVANVRNVAAYLAKYLSKSPGDTGVITGRIWGCSYELSQANKTKIHIPANECSEQLKCLMNKEIDFKEIVQEPTAEKKGFKIGEIFFLNFTKWRVLIKGAIREAFEQTRRMLTSETQYFADFEINSV